jgi:hypothetical protein
LPKIAQDRRAVESAAERIGDLLNRATNQQPVAVERKQHDEAGGFFQAGFG